MLSETAIKGLAKVQPEALKPKKMKGGNNRSVNIKREMLKEAPRLLFLAFVAPFSVAQLHRCLQMVILDW